VDGVVREIKGDPDCPNSVGKICAKGQAQIMNIYDPNRVKTPLRRTNPEKGIGVDPGWVPISWEEAINIVLEKLTKIRKEDPRKLVVSTFDTYALCHWLGPWMEAFGTPNQWIVYFCGQYLHSAMYLTNGTFHCDFDADYCNYLMLVGNQMGFGAGFNPLISSIKVAQARKRGMKVVAIDPICNNAAAKADEWLPIRPGTDAALMWSMINVLLNELGIYDRAYIKKYTNGPYLVKPDGLYIRHDGKPLMWDAVEQEAKPYDAKFKDYAIEGTYLVDGIECTPAFQLVKERAKKYTPELTAEITTIPAETIRKVAREFGEAARIGSTIVIDGKEFPYRPVAANIYRGAGPHKHGVAVALAVMLLNHIVGAVYVPGSHRGINPVGPSWSWNFGDYEGLVLPTPGLPRASDYYHYEVKSPETVRLKELYPMSSTRAPTALLASIDPERYKLPYKPEVLFVNRRNMFLSGCDYELTAKALKSYDFIVNFAIQLDETAEFADLVLPEQVNLEKLQALPNLLNWGHTGQSGYWYWGIKQPVVEPQGEARDWENVLMEIAERMGFLGEVYNNLNTTIKLSAKLQEPYLLDPSSKYTHEEIVDRRLKSQFGEEKGLEWFKEHGYLSWKRTADESYPLPWLTVRFPIYHELYLRAKQDVEEVTQKLELTDWDTSDYEALPDWKPCASYSRSGDFDLIAVTFRAPMHSQSFTSENPWLAEIGELNPYAHKILINTKTAKRKGIKDKDDICVESVVGKEIGKAKVTECIHPEVIGICSGLGSFAKGKPVALGKGINFNKLLPLDMDPISTGVDACTKVKVYKVGGV